MTTPHPWVAVEQTVRQAEIDRYAALSEDFNPLHVDPQAAAASEFGGIVAHGPLALHPLLLALERACGGTLPSGTEVEITYRGPTRPDDVVRAELDAAWDEPDGTTVLEVSCRVEEQTVVSARVVVPAGAAT